MNYILDYLEFLQKKDIEYQHKMFNERGLSYCSNCHKHTFTGLYPFYHAYRRELCEDCGKEYEEFLNKIGAK